MDAHPASELFPLMDGDELVELAKDIKAHGLGHPIVLVDGLVLDGRNRLHACELVGVEPEFVQWQANGLTPKQFVARENLLRRNLTATQRAALALELLPDFEAEAKERQHEGQVRGANTPAGESSLQEQREDGGEATAKAAAHVGVSRSSVAKAKAIAKRKPEVVDKMRSGEVPSIAEAAREAGFEAMGQSSKGVVDGNKRDTRGRPQPDAYYGKGDKFTEATLPLLRYLRGWKKRGFKFAHVNPKDARKRVQAIDELIGGLQQARADLEPRSVKATLTMEARR